MYGRKIKTAPDYLKSLRELNYVVYYKGKKNGGGRERSQASLTNG